MNLLPILRSFCFDLIVYPLSFVYMFFCMPIIGLIPLATGLHLFRVCMHFILWTLQKIVGLDYRIVGRSFLDQALQQGPCILACKHQSVWETIIIPTLMKDFTIVLKKELSRIPLFGYCLKKLKMIFIDRQSGSQAVKYLLIQSRQAVKEGRSVIIFPEGTRTVLGQKSAYQVGVALLYQDLKIPVVPIALNSGKFWGRRSIYKKPGCVTFEFLPPIEPGLSRQEFMQRLESAIETACHRLNTSI